MRLPRSPPVFFSVSISLKKQNNHAQSLYIIKTLLTMFKEKEEELVQFFYFNYGGSFCLMNQDHMLISGLYAN